MPVADKVAKHVVNTAPVAANVARAAQSSGGIGGRLIGGASNIAGNAQMALFFLPMAAGVLGWLGKIPGIGGIFKTASTVVAKPAVFADTHTVDAAMGMAHAKMASLVGTDTFGKVGELATRATGALENAAGKADRYISGVSRGFGFAKDKITTGIANAKGLTVERAVFKGGIHIGSAKIAYDSIEKTSGGVSALKDMVQDLTGKRPSVIGLGWKLMTGGLPKTVRQSGFQFMLSSGVRTIADIVGIAVNTKFAKNDNMGLGTSLAMSFGVVQGVNMLSNFISSGNESPEIYGKMKDVQASGQPLPAGMIAQFIGSADENIKKSGGAENKAAIILSQKYAAEGLTAEAILKKIESGEINRDCAALKSMQVEQSRGKAPQVPLSASQQPAKPAIGMHTNRALQQQMGMPFAMAGAGR